MKPAALDIRIRAKHQITLPAHVVRAVNLREDDTLSVRVINGNIVMTPHKTLSPADDLMQFAGLLKGVWGNTPEEIDASIQDIRGEWER